MLRKRSLRVSICFTLVLLLLFSFSGVSVFAAESKTVSVTVPQSVTCPSYVFGNVLQSISQTTYSYDDGTYKGTLNFSGFGNVTATPVTPYPGGPEMYNYTFDVTYSGTVTTYLPSTKTVTVTTSTYTITAPLAAVPSIRDSISGASFYYDDGSYHGMIGYAGYSNWTETFYMQTQTETLYHISFKIIYSGTVTEY